jgi:Zn-finger nucleic acid-binding protein
MEKLTPSVDVDLQLDYCRRCGGIWFDAREVDRLRQCQPQALAAHVVLGEPAHRMKCHACHASMPRNADHCLACQWKNVILCPTCARPLQPVEQAGVKLDVCRHCRGAWFDNVELAAIWNRKVETLARRGGRGLTAGEVAGDYFLLDAFLWMPHLGLHSMGGGASVVDAAASAGGIAEVAGSAVEGVGDLAGSVFESIASLLGDLF